MKLYKTLKTLQLIALLIITGISLFVVFSNHELKLLLTTHPQFQLLCGILWTVLGISFLFLLIDLLQQISFKREYDNLSRALHSDPVAGIPNRYSCDILIEKYEGQALPDNIGCVMLELTNIMETNRVYGHESGNRLIRNFSNILKRSAVELCFVGRNNGNKFLAIFEDGSQEKIDAFLDKIEQKITIYNRDEENQPALYKYGTAFSATDHSKTITELIALANSRIPRTQAPTDSTQ